MKINMQEASHRHIYTNKKWLNHTPCSHARTETIFSIRKGLKAWTLITKTGYDPILESHSEGDTYLSIKLVLLAALPTFLMMGFRWFRQY